MVRGTLEAIAPLSMPDSEPFNPLAAAPWKDRDAWDPTGQRPCLICHVPFIPMEDGLDQPVSDVQWASAPRVGVDQFHPQSSEHRPRTVVRIMHHQRAIRLRYTVADRFVVSRETENQRQVCEDSCVEFFLQPGPDAGYFNFEFNCCGTMLSHYIEDCRRTPTGFVRHRPLSNADLAHVGVRPSLPRTVWPECPYPITWQLDVLIRLEAIEPHVGAIGSLSGRAFAANFFNAPIAVPIPTGAVGRRSAKN